MFVVGVISDTHGLLRPEACAALAGSNAIIHGSDIGRLEIVERLGEIAPVTAVRGNVDVMPWAESLSLTHTVVLDRVPIFVIHDRADVARYPVPPKVRVVIYGHSHKASAEVRENGVLWFNPGSAGPRRFRLPV